MPIMVSDGTYSGLKVLRAFLCLSLVFCAHKAWIGYKWSPLCVEQGGDWDMTKCVMPDGSTWAPKWNEWSP